MNQTVNVTLEQAFEQACDWHEQGERDRAEALYRQILAVAPNHPQTLHNLAILLQGAKRIEEASGLLMQAIEAHPNYAEAYMVLGNILTDLERYAEAETLYRHALSLNPRLTSATVNLSAALRRAGRGKEAELAVNEALEHDPNNPLLHAQLGMALRVQGRVQEAESALRGALAMNPEDDEARHTLGMLLQARGAYEEAERCYRQVIAARPAMAESYNALGCLLRETGRQEAAVEALREALRINPELVAGYNNLANAYTDQGRVTEALATYREGLARKPDQAELHANLAFSMHYAPELGPKALFAELRDWCARFADPLTPAQNPCHNDPDPERILNVGYVSADLKQHPLGFFTLPILQNHDGNAVRVTVYSNLTQPDWLTERARAAVDAWVDCAAWSDNQLLERIRDDRIDVLVDLSGHTRGNRLRVFAQRAAPVQILGGGCFSSTGLQAMDAVVGDPHQFPAGCEDQFSERILRMPMDNVIYAPPDYMPAVAPPPCLQNGHIIFGCFNNPAKINERVFDLWARILQRLPGARLLLKAKPLGDAPNRARFVEAFAKRGVEPERLLLEGGAPHADFLASYNRMDIALDPFPYSGGLTTIEALWMGVPVVALDAGRLAGRHSVAHLHAAGLPELVAAGPEAYVETALALAAEPDELKRMREQMRPALLHGPLSDHAGYTVILEQMMRRLWRDWCAARRAQS
ncbi:tetratricopeptide repeat protein [Magnetofaba australis]|uniref:protein O-GlcNAc transferase n=1 Tax=Magnetofaba australis IT-1 TaxID=1434232 RepID=A0A1Y2K883_9PROT|nr:tetratricopeptide repeat protein [Magnetofaba australis]OSM06933.1 putative TPR repeat-containing protein [Magnetofaba australis IT-1]